MTTKKLLSCPSCKSTDTRYNYASCGCAVVCTDCGVHGPNKSGEGMQQKAAEAWNALPRVSDELATIIGDLREWLLCAAERYPGEQSAPMVKNRAERMLSDLTRIAIREVQEVWVNTVDRPPLVSFSEPVETIGWERVCTGTKQDTPKVDLCWTCSKNYLCELVCFRRQRCNNYTGPEPRMCGPEYTNDDYDEPKT